MRCGNLPSGANRAETLEVWPQSLDIKGMNRGVGPRNSDMIDPFGRDITYLRVSVTDRCDFRCTYCMAEDMVFLPKAEILTLEELDRVCSAFVRLGTRKLRLTGGEPLGRRDVMPLFRGCS